MKNSELSISDWITVLSSEKHANISYIIGFGAFILAAVVAIFAVRITTDNSWPTVITSVIVGLILLIISSWAIFPFMHRTKVAGKLLDKIMTGKERDVLKIEAEWEEFIAGKKKRSQKK
jgi:hypothetical protein